MNSAKDLTEVVLVITPSRCDIILRFCEHLKAGDLCLQADVAALMSSLIGVPFPLNSVVSILRDASRLNLD